MVRSSLAVALGALLGSTAFLSPLVASADPATATVPDASAVKPVAPAAGPATPPGAQVPATSPAAAASPGASAPSSEDAMRAQRRADRDAFFSAHLAALHAGLALRADQRALWPPVEAAIRDVAGVRGEMWMMHHRATADQDGKINAKAGGSDPVDALRAQGETMTKLGNAIQGLAKATAPLLAGLTTGQKNRLPELVEGLKPKRLIARAFNIEDMGSMDHQSHHGYGERDEGSDGGLRFDRGHRQNFMEGGGEMRGQPQRYGEEDGGYHEGYRGPNAE